jgi:hypothetical protein
MGDVNSSASREEYEAPTIEDIPLHSEEQMLAGCKIASTGGPGGAFCFAAPCSTVGLS